MNRFAELVLYNGGCLPGTPGKRLAFTANLFAKMSEFQTGSLVRFFVTTMFHFPDRRKGITCAI